MNEGMQSNLCLLVYVVVFTVPGTLPYDVATDDKLKPVQLCTFSTPRQCIHACRSLSTNQSTVVVWRLTSGGPWAEVLPAVIAHAAREITSMSELPADFEKGASLHIAFFVATQPMACYSGFVAAGVPSNSLARQ